MTLGLSSIPYSLIPRAPKEPYPQEKTLPLESRASVCEEPQETLTIPEIFSTRHGTFD